jgi:hypothetical protein
MRYASRSIPSAALSVTLVFLVGPSFAHSIIDGIRAAEIAGALKGKVCTTKGGATFTFTRDGHYAYDGMWTDSGHYSVHDGAVTVLLGSGLERDFAVSRRDGILYLEQTAIRCASPGEAWPRVGGATIQQRH